MAKTYRSRALGAKSDGSFAELSAEMTHFLNHTSNLVKREVEIHLASHEAKEKENNTGTNQAMLAWRPFSTRRPKSVESKDLHFTMDRHAELQINEKGTDIRPPALNSTASDVLGDIVCTMISSDSDNMAAVCESLGGKLLPKRLRQFIWMDKILRSDKVYKGVSIEVIEKEAREKYGRMLEHKLAELKLRSATRSPLSGLIENAVVEKYANSACMQQFATDEQMILESSKTLNILYVYNGTYEPYLIHWLFPLQMAFKQIPTKAEHPYELFMYLHLLVKNLYPSWLEIFAMSERVMNILETEDTELFAHFQISFRKNVNFDSKDFLVELIGREREESLKQYADSKEKEPYPTFQEELLASPVIFLRKWMGEGFVNSLDLPAVLLIWDQLFMHNWNRSVMENFCLAVLLLLKDSFMAAKDYPAIRQIFLHNGYHLFTSDIQRAWIHLQQGGLLADIQGMNRLNERRFRHLYPSLSVERGPQSFRVILPISINDVLLKLVLPIQNADRPSNQTWSEDFDPLAVKLTVSVFYGPVKLRSKTTSLKPSLVETVKQKEAKNNELTLFTIQFNDLFSFESIDPSDYVNASESGAEPFILLKVVYSKGEKERAQRHQKMYYNRDTQVWTFQPGDMVLVSTAENPLTLGWIKVYAFEQEDSSTQEVWKPRELSELFSLQPGNYPDDNNESAPGISRSGLHPSTIVLTICDPTREKQGRETNLVKENRGRKEDTLTPLPHLWVQHNESTVLPSPTSLNQCFDLYIDALHFIPDNSTITKVSAQILKSGRNDMPAVMAFPDFSSPARNPEFKYCQVLNTEEQMLNAATTILFQVSTVDSDSGNLAIIGNCMLHVFNNDGKLNVGGFQLKLRSGMPSKQRDSLVPSDFQQYPFISCCSLLVRLLPHTEDLVPMPRYSSGFYFTDEAKPTRSEMGIMSTFQKDVSFPSLVKDMAGGLMEKEQSQENNLNEYYEKRIGGKMSSLLQPSLNYINIHHVSRYRQEVGIRLKIKQAFGLEAEGLYINAFARILKGAQSVHLPELQQHWGGEEKFLTRQHDFTSLQRSPKWTDPSVVLHPYLDNHSVLFVQIFGLEAAYIPNPSSDQRGRVVSQELGQELELKPLLGWSVFPLFDRHYVFSGVHSAPIFQGSPSAEFLQSVSTRPLKTAIEEGLKKKSLMLLKTYGSVTMEAWDGHYFDDKHYALPIINDLLTVDKVKKFVSTQTRKKGKEMSMLVLQSLDKKQQKLQRTSPEYQRHQHFYEESMADTFYNLIVSMEI
ncbi:uncharacterized protein O3C94_002907 [Discoglossus pictus]